MQFTITTDYAIRIMLVLSQEKDIVTAEYISNKMKIPLKYLVKMLRDFVAVGLVETKRGRNGGYMIAKSPDEITLFDVISVTEPTLKINSCLEEDCCSREAIYTCPVRNLYVDIQKTIDKRLKGYTIADMVKEEKRLTRKSKNNK